MRIFKPTNKSNPCPVCSDIKGKCRIVGDSGQIQCMTALDPGFSPNYKFVKLTKCGTWGIHYPVTEQDYDRELWQQRKAEREQQALEIERERLDKLLSPEQRHKQIKAILGQLTLNAEDKRYLLARGVPVSIIDNCRSIEQWQPLTDRVHVNTPGVWSNGKGLSNGDKGILVAVEGVNGHYVAMRIHDPEAKNKDNGAKYRWLSSRKRNVTPKLANGLNPVSVNFPANWSVLDKVGVCEGVEWKAQSAANRLGYPVIGFSGVSDMANMSKAYLAEIIEYIKSKNKKISKLAIALVPDAGMAKNDNVMRCYRRLLTNVKVWEHKGCVEWWQQGASKDIGDIDEIDKSVKIQTITIEQFLGTESKKRNNPTLHQAFINLSNKLFGGVTGLQRNAKRMVAGLIHSPVDHYYESGEGAKLYAKLAREGHKWILDISGTGCGKTFTVSELQIQEMFLHPDGDDEILMRLFYIPPSYRNPTNAKIEDDWYETPARNNGYFINYSKQTELGNPYRESLVGLGEIDDHERTQSNCHKAELFHQHYAAGRSTEGLCKTCDLRDKCAVKKGEGYGYISEVKKWIAEAKIRTSAQWLDKDKVSICSTGLIFDEAGQAPWQKSIKVKSEYIHKLMAKIRRADKNLHRQLVELDYAIADLIDAEDLPRYGYDTYQILQALNVDKSLEQVLERILEIELDGREIVENEEELQEIDPVFLFDLLRISLGITRGSLSLGKNELTISVPNDRLIQACHAAKFVICQDATMARSEMAMQLGIKESDIVVIKQRQEVPVNLVVEQWKGIGLLGNNRSDAVKELVIKIREQLLALYPELGIIEWKQHGQASDLIHCGDSRGSNAYKEKTTVASIGLSRPNMTAIRMQFETMSGHIIDSFEDSSFREFYGHKIAANLIQEIGRLRANRRPNEQLKFILVGDGDITFLEHLGFDVVSKDASEMLGGLDLGQVGAKSRYVNLGIRLCRQLGKELWESLNMSQAAEYLERAGSSVSRWVRRWFGVEGDRNGTAFQRFKALVYAAVYGGRTEGFSQEQEINITMMGEMLKQVRHCGQDLGKELKSLIDACGWSVFLESVRRLEGDYGIKLLAHIFDVAIQLG